MNDARRSIAIGINKLLSGACLLQARNPLVLYEETMRDMVHQIAMRVVYELPELDGEEATLP